jgi:hypothetical protein
MAANVDTHPAPNGIDVWGDAVAVNHPEPAARIPEWRRRSMEGRGRFDAVTDTTGLVAL